MSMMHKIGMLLIY